jgi:uncharacterized repeat protein (TIGR04076 family)
MTQIIARVTSQQGRCEVGHKVGDEFVISPTQTPAGMCPWAFYTLFPFAEALQFGGSFPWEKEPAKTRVACPDPDNPVIFELRRVAAP